MLAAWSTHVTREPPGGLTQCLVCLVMEGETTKNRLSGSSL